MARVGRLAGALLVHSRHGEEDHWYLVGDTKVPCDWQAAGFVEPPIRDVSKQRWIRLAPTRSTTLEGPCLRLPLDGEAAAACIAARLLVARNGSVSERLWRMVWDPEDTDEAPKGELDARWLVEIPAPIFERVRDAVLRCS
jgi:hypothetical protein